MGECGLWQEQICYFYNNGSHSDIALVGSQIYF